MPPITILTDSAAQFIHPTYPGMELVKTIRLNPVATSSTESYRLAATSDQDVQIILQESSQNSGYVFAILSSGYLSALPNQILRLMKASSAAPRLVIIDSLSIGLGTGFLVEKAAGMAVNGIPHADIEQILRECCTTLYTAVILPDLSSLVPIGLVDAAQAKAASILGIQSIFSMEEGLPTPLVKVRTRRAAYEYLVEFIDEFEKFHLIAAILDSRTEQVDLQIITDHLDEFYPDRMLQSFTPNYAWKTIFGEHSYGLVIVSNEESR
jgi:fatty acid-binding protein DegV